MAAGDHGGSVPDATFWVSQLSGGLPQNFNFSVVKTAVDARKLILALPSCDRGKAAVGLYRRHRFLGAGAAYAGLMEAWDHDHRDVVEAFGSPEQLVTALKKVAPRLSANLSKQVNVWRGTIAGKEDPLWSSVGLSWTRSRSVACWFALRDYVPTLQPSLVPVVLHASVERSAILALHNARAEQETIIDIRALTRSGADIALDGTGFVLSKSRNRFVDFCPDNRAFAYVVADWRLASARYQHWKTILEVRRRLRLQRIDGSYSYCA